MTEFRPSGRVVVTGMGAVTPLGTGVDAFWPRMVNGENGVDRITLMDSTAYATHFAGEVKDFNAEDWLDRKEARRIDRFLAFSVAAAEMAMRDSNFPRDDEELKLETGVLIGSGIGGLITMSEQSQKLFTESPDRVSPFLVPHMIPDMASGLVSIKLGLKGPNICVVTACATGNNAIGEACHMIRRGDVRAMLAGGAEAPISPIGLAGFCSARAMSTNESKNASRPFDLNRDGFIMGEGAGVLVLEDHDFAVARGAKILCEIIGYGTTADAYHMTAPDPNGDGAIRSMKLALRSAGIKPEDVSYVNAHGTSTLYNDRTESLAIKAVFGEHAYKMPVSSTKSSIGHCLGAAGAVEAVICALAIRDSVVPPTINYETPDPDCDLDYVPNQSRKHEVNIALSNAFGFGGHNATLVIKKYAG